MRTFLLSFFVLVAANSFSQTVNVSMEDRSKYLVHNNLKWSLREEVGYPHGDHVIQIDANGLKAHLGYTAKYSSQSHPILIRKLDKEGKEIAVNNVEGGEKMFGPVRSRSISFDDRIMLFYFRYTDKDTMKFYMSEVDKENLQLVNTVQLFSYAKKNATLLLGWSDLPTHITLEASPDRSKLLVMVPAAKEQYFSCVIDRGLKVIRKNLSAIAGSEGLTISQVYVDNTGNSIAAISKWVTSLVTFTYSNDKFLVLHKADNSEKLVKIESLGLQSSLHNIAFKGSSDNSQVFITGGLTGEMGIAAIAFTNVELDKFKINQAKSLPYPPEFAKRVYEVGYGIRKRKVFELEETRFELVDFGNGELAICGTPFMQLSGTNSVVSYAGPVMVAFLNKKKEPLFTMIPRSQHYCYGSFPVYLPYHDKLVVIYNDYAKNINSPLLPNDVQQKAGSTVSKLSLACAVITRDGSVESRKMLSEGISRDNYFDTSEMEIIDNNKVIIPSASADKKTDEQKVAVITVQ